MHEVSPFRLYVLRAMNLLVVIGMGLVLWPDIFHHEQPWTPARASVNCPLAALCVRCTCGLGGPAREGAP